MWGGETVGWLRRMPCNKLLPFTPNVTIDKCGKFGAALDTMAWRACEGLELRPSQLHCWRRWLCLWHAATALCDWAWGQAGTKHVVSPLWVGFRAVAASLCHEEQHSRLQAFYQCVPRAKMLARRKCQNAKMLSLTQLHFDILTFHHF